MSTGPSLNARLDDARAEAETKAHTDGLTGLRNRCAFDDTMARLGRSQTDYAILHIDLDLFKQVNDTLGHAAGDAVLCRVANVLRQHTRKDDVSIRTGGDEFVVICPGLVAHSRLAELAENLIRDISEPTMLEDVETQISASIGIAVSVDTNQSRLGIVSDYADIALYAAKRSGRGRHVIWTPDLGETLADLKLVRDTQFIR